VFDAIILAYDIRKFKQWRVRPLPVCLKCGKLIEPGREYCDDCGATGQEQVERLMAVAKLSEYRPLRRRGNKWLALSLLGLAAILIAIAVALIISIPTGSEFKGRAQASICRSKMRRIMSAVESFFDADGKYPPAGRLDGDHPLITDQYLSDTPRCPTTKHSYILEHDGSKPMVSCDSGLPGHEI
jgi:hypothetical protein